MSFDWQMQVFLGQADAPPVGPVDGGGGGVEQGGGGAVTGEAAGLPDDPAGSGGAGTAPPASPFSSLWIFVLMIGVFWLIVMLPQRREKKKRAEMLGALKKGDKIQTIGGILGSVVEVRETEVVLKVDEANNVRMRFARPAIQVVLPDGKAEKE